MNGSRVGHRVPAGSVTRVMHWLRPVTERVGALTALHLVIITLLLLLSSAAWYGVQRNTEMRRVERFERQTDRMIEIVYERLANHEDALQTAKSWLTLQPELFNSSEQWQRAVESLELGRRYAGVSTLKLLKPAHAMENDAAKNAQGWLQWLNSDQETRMALANGEPRLLMLPRTGGGSADGDVALLLHLPAEREMDAAPQDLHVVYSPFTLESLFQPLLNSARKQITIQVSESGTALLAERVGNTAQPLHDELVRSVVLNLHGRQWLLEMKTNAHFLAATAGYGPRIVVVAGLLLELMLIVLFSTMAQEKRALRATSRLGEHLTRRTIELEASNTELERFACVVSHDLKTPLRGIESLAHWIAEDLALDSNETEAGQLASHHLARLHKRIRQMRSLIDGILNFSTQSVDPATVETVALRELMAEIIEVLDIDSERIDVGSELPCIVTSRISLSQVLTNLVDNAFKHHPSPATAKVRVEAEQVADTCVIRISDDGDGIDPSNHDRVFDFLDSLGSQHEDSTGIGLAIVKRIVEQIGGTIQIISARGKGCCFVVHWPNDTSAAVTVDELDRWDDDNRGSDSDGSKALRRVA